MSDTVFTSAEAPTPAQPAPETWFVDGNLICTPQGVIATVYGVNGSTAKRRTEARSRARLIAAAPELLAALSQIKAAVEHGWPAQQEGGPGSDYWMAALANMIAAIAKAEGRAQ